MWLFGRPGGIVGNGLSARGAISRLRTTVSISGRTAVNKDLGFRFCVQHRIRDGKIQWHGIHVSEDEILVGYRSPHVVILIGTTFKRTRKI